jgi:hypothetical protein
MRSADIFVGGREHPLAFLTNTGRMPVTRRHGCLRSKLLGCESAINARQPLRQREHIIDNRIANFAVQIAQL